LAQQVSFSLDLCNQPINQLETTDIFLKKVHKIAANGFLSIYFLCWFDKNIFQAEILNHIIIAFLDDFSQPSIWFLETLGGL
jgi:hypothetical protein